MTTDQMVQAITDSLNNDTTALRKLLLGSVIASLQSLDDNQLQELCNTLGISTD